MSLQNTNLPEKKDFDLTFTLPEKEVVLPKEIELAGPPASSNTERFRIRKSKSAPFDGGTDIPFGEEYRFRYSSDAHNPGNDKEILKMTSFDELNNIAL